MGSNLYPIWGHGFGMLYAHSRYGAAISSATETRINLTAMARKTEKDANDGSHVGPQEGVVVWSSCSAEKDWSVCVEGCRSCGRNVCARRVPEVWHWRGVGVDSNREVLHEEWFEIRVKRGISLRRKVGVE